MMAKKHSQKQKKQTRKKYHHTHDASLPSIEVTPNIENAPLPYMPKICVDSNIIVSRRHIRKIQKYLCFANPHDLRYLSCIRLISPSSSTRSSKEAYDGCYFPKEKGQEAEIWLSTDIFTFPGLKWALINRFFLKQDRIFETLFHELGHHKAYHIRLVSKYKQEAYAEKYMHAYKDAWLTSHMARRIGQRLFDGLFTLFSNRYTMLMWLFFTRKKSSYLQHMYDLQAQYVFRKISGEEWSQKMDDMFPHFPKRKTSKKKGNHPLHQQEYRDKFQL